MSCPVVHINVGANGGGAGGGDGAASAASSGGNGGGALNRQSTILTVNQDGIILSVDRNCCSMFGYDLNELMGHKVDMIIPSPYMEQHSAYMANYVRTGQARIIGRSRVVQGLHKSGEVFSLRLSVSAVGSGPGMLFVAIIDKLGETKAIVTIAENGAILTANQQTEEMYGYTNAELVGQNVRMLMTSQTAAAHDAYLKRYYKKRSGSVINAVRNVAGRHKDGTVFPVALEVTEETVADKLVFTGYMEKVGGDGSGVDEMHATFTLDTRGCVVSCADKFVRALFGYCTAELVGNPISAILQSVATSGSSDAVVDPSDRSVGSISSLDSRSSRKAPKRTGGSEELSSHARTAAPSSTDTRWCTPGTHVAIITHKDGSQFSVQLHVFAFESSVDGQPLYSACVRRVRSVTDASPMLDQPSSKTVGDYSVLETVGTGTYGRVKLATHMATNKSVAIKVLRKGEMDSVELTRTLREVEILKQLNHPHVAKCYDVLETADKVYIVLELGRGELFSRVMQSGGLSEFEACMLFRQIASAVEYCHARHVVHRDIKHKNILLDDCGRVKLIDFGLSNFFQEGESRRTFCGTPAYAAPEMVLGRSYKGPEVDVWSCGVVLYSMIAGAFPFENVGLILKCEYTPLKNVSEACNDLIAGMLCGDREKRLTMAQVRRHRWCSAAHVAQLGAGRSSGQAESGASRVRRVQATVVNADSRPAGNGGNVIKVPAAAGHTPSSAAPAARPVQVEVVRVKADGSVALDAVMAGAPVSESAGAPAPTAVATSMAASTVVAPDTAATVAGACPRGDYANSL